MKDIFNNAFNSYFAKTDITEKEESEKITKPNKQNLSAKGNISNIDKLAEIIRKILNAAWGDSWGEIKPTISKSSTIDGLTIPIITYDINSREISEKKPLKPILSDVIYEEVNGEPTGDAILVYRQWFDCIVEFNVYARNSLESRSLAENFETIINLYIGYFKEQGISEMFFLKEIPADKSINYIQGIPMRSLMYFIRLERIHEIKQSLVNNIDIAIKSINVENNTFKNSVDNNKITYDF